MAQSILTHTGSVAPRRSVRRLTLEELKKGTEIAKRENFDKIIKEKFGDSMTLLSTENTSSVVDSSDFTYDTREDDEDEPLGWIDGNPIDAHRIPVFENSLSDSLINAEVLLPHGEELKLPK